MTPKAEYHDKVRETDNCHSFLEAAKILKIGRNTLTAKLRAKGVLMRDNVPYESYMKRGYFRVKQSVSTNRQSGKSHMNHTTYVTGEGIYGWQGF